jgi:heme exporter protein D
MELGRYADTVLAAYGVTLALITLLVLVSWERAVRVRRRLTELESRRKTDG